ncbi:pyridoxal phosphate-dependent aminotransferase [Bosea sp. 2RAB26]|uniref:pyridoxal phosphate-dependent aminotransferase n=1 Tax=Bosea sp. 2RAB26 TaxID=3237476 RepID=UPI003F91EF07
MNYENSIIRQVKPSPSMAISLQARKMVAEGRPVIDLSLGEPEFDTPAHIIDAAYAAARAGQTRYTAADGTPELKKAIADKFARENGLDYKPSEISVANGAKQVIFNALMVTLEEGDEVLVPAPYWVSYTDMVLLMRGTPKVVACTAETGFKISPEVLRASLTPRTRWLILNAPSNPSGATYGEAELKALGTVLADFPNVLVMSDEIYEHILYDGHRFTSFAKACPQLRDRTMIVNGVSKAYAMTGWRIGYAAGPEGLIKAIGKLQSQSSSNPSSVSQAAALAALTGPQDFVGQAGAEYAKRRDLVAAALEAVPGLRIIRPEGAFYVFIDISSLVGKTTPQEKRISNDADLATYLLEQGEVAGVPGSAFGLDGHIRISFAASEQLLKQACQRIATAVAAL